MASSTSGAVEQLQPAKKGVIAEVKSMTPFTIGGSEWHGIDVVMDNGDTFEMYEKSSNATNLQAFEAGKELTYQRKLVTKGGRSKWKLDNYSFCMPRTEQFEPLIVGKIADSISYAASYAKDVCVGEGSMNDFEHHADRILAWMKKNYFTETFEPNARVEEDVPGGGED